MTERRRLAIIGAGALGQLVAHHAALLGYALVGFFDDTLAVGASTAGGSVLGSTAGTVDAFRAGRFDEFLVAIGYLHMDVRAEMFEALATAIPTATLIHPSCHVDPTATVGPGSFLLPGCVLDAYVRVGRNVVLNTATAIAHHSVVGDHTFVGPGARIAGCVAIGARCFIGVGSVLIDNITLAAGVQTGGGAVVTKSLAEPGLYVGVPARLVESQH